MSSQPSINRRNVLIGVIATTTAITVGKSYIPQVANAQPTEFRWRMVSRWNEAFPDQLAAAQRLADRIAAMSAGRLIIEVFPPDELVPFPETLNAISEGTVEMCRSLAYDWRTQSPVLEVFTVVPYGLTQNEMSAWIHYLGGQELWDEAYAPFGVKAFPAGSLGAQSFGWFQNEINRLSDLQGLRFRTTGVAVDVMARLGVTATTLGLDEIRQALQADELDGFELVGPLVDLQFGLHELGAPYYYFPSYNQPSGLVELVVNRAQYEALPTDLQQIIAIAAQAEYEQGLAEANMGNASALNTLVNQHQVQVRQLPPDVLTALGNASGEVIAEMRSRGDEMMQRTIDSFLSARQILMDWSQVSEQSYLNARALSFVYG
ncbi:MAG: TRAP transporter substrate-binding protein [Leptolyngbya sp. SIO1E4]|nr:TRAP transporter substrate-binding protein [Leptolyngbya sp. SIO1E4]